MTWLLIIVLVLILFMLAVAFIAGVVMDEMSKAYPLAGQEPGRMENGE
jgi:hypothetical protein